MRHHVHMHNYDDVMSHFYYTRIFLIINEEFSFIRFPISDEFQHFFLPRMCLNSNI